MSDKNLNVGLEINTEVKNLSDLNGMIDSLEKSGQKVDFLRLRSEVLAKEWDKLNPQEQAQRIRRIKEAALAAAGGTDKLSNSTKSASQSTDRLRKSATQAAKKTRLLTRAQKRLGETCGSVNGQLKKFALGLAGYFSVKAIGGFFTSAVSGAASLEEQLDKVQAVSGATNDEMAKIAETAEQLGASTRYTATEAAQGFEILARAGLDANQSIETLPNVLALAQGSSIDLAEAAGYITKAVAGMNLDMSESGRVADVLAKAAASANTDVAGLGQALSYAAPSAASLGVSLEETVAIIGKFADAGIDASRAGTALNSIMSQFSNPASKFRQELSAIGINTNNFSEALEQLAQSGDKGQKAILAVGQEAGPALKALLSQGMPSLRALIAELQNAKGSAQDMANTMDGNLMGVLRGLGSAWDSLKINLGKPLLEPIKEQVARLSGVIRKLVDSGEIKKLGEYFAQVFDKMAKSVVDFVENFTLDDTRQKVTEFADDITTKFNKVGAAFGLVYNTLSAGFNTIKSVIFGVAGVVTQAVSDMSQGMADFLDKIPGLDKVTESMKIHAGAMRAVASAYKTEAKAAFDAASTAADNVGNHINTLTEKTRDNTQAVSENAQAINKEAEAFNEKSRRLAELKQQETDYIANGKQHTQAYNAVVVERINLETELQAKVKDKTLADKENTQAVNESTEATKRNNQAKKDTDKNNRQTNKTTKETTKVTQKNTATVKESTEAVKESTKANKTNSDALKGAQSAAQSLAKITAMHRNELKASKTALAHYNDAMRVSVKNVQNADTALRSLNNNYLGAKRILEQYRAHVDKVDAAIERLNGDLSKTGLTIQDVNEAAGLAHSGIEKLDEARLNNLNQAIDNARQKLRDLKDDAKATADDLQAELERLQGDDSLSRRLEQKRKMAALEEKLAAAKARNSAEEISAYEKAIHYQRQIFEQKQKQYKAERRQERHREVSRHTDNTANHTGSRRNPTNGGSPVGGLGGGNTVILQMGDKNIPIPDVAQAVLDEIRLAGKRGAGAL